MMYPVIFSLILASAMGCTDFYMNFSHPSIKLSVRTMDLGATSNWSITSWPAGSESYSDHPDDKFSFRWESKYNTIGITGNWFGDDHYGFPSLFGDAINEKGLSCGMLTLVGTKYEEPSIRKKNIFYGTFCQYITQSFGSVVEAMDAMDSIVIWGPAIVQEHFILRDSTGVSLVIELMDGKRTMYLDYNDGQSGWGIMTNEPTFDYHLTNIEHYEWKRSLARQAVGVPGGWYPEERYLRVHMVKSGMQEAGHFDTEDFQTALSLCSQVLNTVTVPMGDQYGTDTGEGSGEGSAADHTMWGMVRDHADPAIYWRDSGNPSFRRLRLRDIDFSAGRKTMILESGPAFIDMSDKMQ